MKKSISVALLCLAIFLPGQAREHSHRSTYSVRPYKKQAVRPANATAVCKDGTLSYSQHRRGTCSHHGGVRRWNANAVK
jgi:hypothetical protein